MAYPAVISLKRTIAKLLETSTMVPRIKALADELDRLQEILELLDKTKHQRVNAITINFWDAEIREAAFKLDDVVEWYLLHRRQPQICAVDDEGLMQEIDSFSTKAAELGYEYKYAIKDPRVLSKEEDDGDETIDDGFGGNDPVGLPDQVDGILNKLLDFGRRQVNVFLVGMAGIGKTHIARKIYRDPLIAKHFDVRVWVRVGQKTNNAEEVLEGIYSQIECKPRDEIMETSTEVMLWLLKKKLRGGLRVIIFLDDVWSKDLSDQVIHFFPKVLVRFVLTTRIEELAYNYKINREFPEENSDLGIHHMRFLDNEESWELLRENVFGDEYCSPELEIAGKKIAENCEGLPLLILTVADILRGFDKTKEYWNKVAEMKTTTFPEAYERIWDVLYSSYEFLPQHLKPCFLYMGVFPQRFEIFRSRIAELWSVEDFFHLKLWFLTFEGNCLNFLKAVVSNSLAIRCKQSSEGKIKSFRIHSAYWYLCVKEAKKIKFFHVLKRLSDAYEEGIEGHRRLSVQNSMLFGIQEVYNSVAAIQTTRSLLFTGGDHQYPVPLCFDLVFLKVLDALAIRFYEFPIEVLKLVQLKYLSLTHNGELPSSISNLQELRHLILRQHHKIAFVRDSTSLPNEIWDIRKLEHLRITRSNLPDPTDGSTPLKLRTLCVDARSCRERVFRSLPYLSKLGIYIELPPDAAETLRFFEHVNLLGELESITCVVANPRVVLPQPHHLSNFPQYLRKLSLSGLGYPWDYITAIGSLPRLKVLKLRCCAFRGPEWNTKAGEFQKLEFLLLEDMDLVQWKTDEDSDDSISSFVGIRYLIIRHCYKFKAIPQKMGRVKDLKIIELVECRTSVVDSARKIQDSLPSCQVVITSSWNR